MTELGACNLYQCGLYRQSSLPANDSRMLLWPPRTLYTCDLARTRVVAQEQRTQTSAKISNAVQKCRSPINTPNEFTRSLRIFPPEHIGDEADPVTSELV